MLGSVTVAPGASLTTSANAGILVNVTCGAASTCALTSTAVGKDVTTAGSLTGAGLFVAGDITCAGASCDLSASSRVHDDTVVKSGTFAMAASTLDEDIVCGGISCALAAGSKVARDVTVTAGSFAADGSTIGDDLVCGGQSCTIATTQVGRDATIRMLDVAGEPPPGAPLCSRGCHVLLLGARFDPHTGEALALAEPDRPAEPSPAAWPFWEFRLGPEHRFAEYELAPADREPAPDAIDIDRLEREIHAAVRGSADVEDTMRNLVAAIGEYGEHLRSHTAVMKNLATATGELAGTTSEMREFFAALAKLLARIDPGATPSNQA